MSKEKRRIKEQMLVRNAITAVNRQLADLENSRNKYIAAAATARENGIASQYNLAKNAIRIVTAQKTVVEQMLLNLQISSQIKDVSEMTKSFADGMKLLSGSITDNNDSLKFDKVSRQMNKAVMSTQLKQAESDAFLDATQVSFSSFASSPVNALGEDEIDRLIDARIGGGSFAMGNGVDAEIAELERKLKANNGEV